MEMELLQFIFGICGHKGTAHGWKGSTGFSVIEVELQSVSVVFEFASVIGIIICQGKLIVEVEVLE